MRKKMTDLSGMTVGLVTPSSPASHERVQASAFFFERAGLRVKLGSHHNKYDRFLAGSDVERAADLMHHFQDKEVDFLVVTGGGAGSLRVLPYLDFDIIAQNKKPLIGFSDTTSLQLGLYAKTQLRSFTGFTCRDIADFEVLDPMIEHSFVSCVQNLTYETEGAKILVSGHAQAPLIGGNLSCLSALMGTPFQPSLTGHILIIEDVWAEPFLIDTMLAQLWLAGVFNEIAGLVFGQFYGCEPKHHPERDGTVLDILRDWAQKLHVPTVYDFPYGHVNSRTLWPIGGEGALDATTGQLKIVF